MGPAAASGRRGEKGLGARGAAGPGPGERCLRCLGAAKAGAAGSPGRFCEGGGGGGGGRVWPIVRAAGARGCGPGLVPGRARLGHGGGWAAGPVLGATGQAGRGGGCRGSRFRQPLCWRAGVGTAFFRDRYRPEGEAPAVSVL